MGLQSAHIQFMYLQWKMNGEKILQPLFVHKFVKLARGIWDWDLFERNSICISEYGIHYTEMQYADVFFFFTYCCCIFFLSFSLLNIFLLPGIIWNFTLFHFYVYFVILLMIIKHNINSIIPLLLCNPIMEKICGFIIRFHCIVFFSFSCAFFIQSFFAPNGGRGGNYEILNSEI